MQSIGLNEIREKFLSFFEGKTHLRIPSFPLVPQNDKSLLLINSGMAPMKPYFTGQEIPPSKRVTTCQKCLRTIDIENVGKTDRHCTFFEMLGNFSFGDYFKEEIIPWSWEFLTEVLNIPVEKLFASVYLEDDEAYDIWNKKVGLPAEKIVRLGKDDNFWEVGLGPCGPSSEIYYDRGEQYGCGKDGCSVGCDCDRFMEIWNLVFTQFNKNEDGSYSKLDFPNIDTGMGLERIASAMQQADSVFDVDTMQAIRNQVSLAANVTYRQNAAKDISIRIITDHIRSVTFLTADGVLPSNEGRGYVLRRLLRRAVRHGKLLGIKEMFLSDLSQTVIEVSKDAYPELLEKSDYIHKVLSVEERRFYDTIDQGMEILKGFITSLRQNVKTILEGSEAFKLYDTYGFPLDLMKEILAEEGLSVDEDAFDHEMLLQKERARSAREESTYMGSDETVYNKLDTSFTTVFEGYDADLLDNAQIMAITSDDEVVENVGKGTDVSVILDRTPFYAESGGQAGDSGFIRTESGTVQINDCIKIVGGKFAHIGTVTDGTIGCGQKATVGIDNVKRMSTSRNHTATHLLQKALREVLGSHVEQAGSMVSHERLRFDFTHFAPLSRDEIARIENIVNEKIWEGLDVSVMQTSLDEARKMGAMALFGEKYGSSVRVVDISGYSIELCGGTHLKNTSQVGIFKILSEGGVAAGVRRIDALTGRGAHAYYKDIDNIIAEVGNTFKTTPDHILSKVQKIITDTRDMRQMIERFNAKAASGIVDDMIGRKENYGGFDVIIESPDGLDMNGLRTMCDKLRDKMNSGVILLGSVKDEKINFIAIASEDAVKAGIHAGDIVKSAAAIAGGGGGGRPAMAQAGGKDPSKLKEALVKGKEIIVNALCG